MLKILTKFFITCSRYGFTPYKEDSSRIYFHKTLGKAADRIVAEIVIDIIEDKNILLFFYDFKNQKSIIIDSTEAFNYQEVHWGFCESVNLAKTSLLKEEEKSLSKEKWKSFLKDVSELNVQIEGFARSNVRKEK